MKTFLFFITGIILCFSVAAQDITSSVLIKDAGRHYYFMRQFTTGRSKAQAYNRAKDWVNASLDPSDNYMLTDDAGNDSICTMAFMSIDDLPQVQNQVISYKFLLKFNEGSVDVYADGFVYAGDNKANGDSYDLPLANLRNIDAATQPAIIYAFDKKFQLLMNGLERTLH